MNRERFAAAPTFDDFIAGVEKNVELWNGVYSRVRLPDDLVEKARRLPGPIRLVSLTEDWCGDAVNTLPVFARFAAKVGWEFRVLSRDDNLDLMDSHLTDGRSRSIPIVIVYDEDFNEIGWWGPRPAEVQSWVMNEGLSLSSPERYKVVRRWYAKDRGRTALTEVLALIDE